MNTLTLKTMTLIDTLEYFIDDVGQHLECLAWEIQEETNYDDEGHQERFDDFCEQYDEHKARLDDLEKIKSIIESQQ
jgi:arginyl-tRNA synthetase